MRDLLFGDDEFRRYMDVKWGVDLLGRKGSQRATDAGLDPYYFWAAHIKRKDVAYLHADNEEIVY